MKILVTGGAGYIGSVLVPELLKSNHQVTVIDNFLYDQRSLNMCCQYKNFELINSDVRDFSRYDKSLKSADLIIPLAAIVGAPACSKKPIEAKGVNNDNLMDLFKLVSQEQMFIMPTTNSAYGTGDENNFCDENTPLKPISQYAKEKVEVEKVLLEHKNAVSLRLATVFGVSNRMRIDLLVNDFVYRAKKDGFVVLYEPEFKRNYIHVKDVVKAFLHVMENYEIMNKNIYNVGLSNANLSKIELCEEIKRQLPNFIFPVEHNQKDPDQRNYLVSNAKIEATGYKPEVSISEGIRELIVGYESMTSSKYTNI